MHKGQKVFGFSVTYEKGVGLMVTANIYHILYVPDRVTSASSFHLRCGCCFCSHLVDKKTEALEELKDLGK